MKGLKTWLKRNRKVVRWHVVAWVVFAIYDNIYSILLPESVEHVRWEISFAIYNFLGSVFTFYSLLFCLHMYARGRRGWASIGVVAVFLIVGVVTHFAIIVFDLPYTRNPASTYLRLVVVGSLQFAIPFFLYALAYIFAHNLVAKEKEVRSLKEKRLEQEKENLVLERAFVRSRINPHFLFNMLNYFYAKTFATLPDVSDGILKLSEMMHYSIGENEGKEGLVLLNKEIEQIRRLIDLQNMRFSERLHLNFVVQGDTEGKRVIPMTLITIVENVFKHGELFDRENPVSIKCNVDEAEGRLRFEVHNKKGKGPKDLSTGIGLQNTESRLRIFYGDNYKFHVLDSGPFFTVLLELPVLTDTQLIKSIPSIKATSYD